MKPESTLAAIQEAERALLENAPADTAAVLREARRLAALAYFVDAYNFYRKLDFFAATPHLSDADLARQWVAQGQENDGQTNWFALEVLSEQDRETLFLMSDRARVWSSDLELDVCAENRSYTKFLRELAAISRGLFAPENIVEEWSDMPTQTHDYGGIEVEEGRIHVFFTHDEQPFYFEPDCCGDWLSVASPLQAVNEALQPTEFRFEQLEFDGVTGLILLSAPEKKLMQEKRALSFVRLPDANSAENYRSPDGDFDIADPFADS